MKIEGLIGNITGEQQNNLDRKITISVTELEKLQQALSISNKNLAISSAINDFLLENSVTKCVVEDTAENVIYPFDSKQLLELQKILSYKKPNNNEIKYNNEETSERLLYEYSEHRKKINLNGSEEEYVFKCLTDISHHKDYITGLDKREVFVDKFEDYLHDLLGRRLKDSHGRRISDLSGERETFAYLFFDMDWFKQVNDTYGHDGGDEMLKSFSQILKENLRDYDLVSRFGGDEFIVVLKDISEEGALYKAEEIRKKYNNQEVFFNGDLINIEHTLSIGIYYYDVNLINKNELQDISEIKDKIRIEADKNLFAAKQIGKNTIVISSNADDNIKKRV